MARPKYYVRVLVQICVGFNFWWTNLRYHLNDAIIEGGVPFERAYGMTAFEYPAIDDRFNQVFNQAMSSHSTWIMKKILDVYGGFKGVKVLVDVGGGVGATLKMITSKHPFIKGINFDLPHVLADAPSYPGKTKSRTLGLCKTVHGIADGDRTLNSLLLVISFDNLMVC